jgi:hypothetical protein
MENPKMPKMRKPRSESLEQYGKIKRVASPSELRP